MADPDERVDMKRVLDGFASAIVIIRVRARGECPLRWSGGIARVAM